MLRPLGMVALVAALAVLAAGCGGKKSSSGTTGGSNSGKTYPLLRVVWDAPDYMDPALYYTVAAYQLTNYVWTGLVGYRHENGPGGATLVPYLAKSMPTVSADGKNFKFTLRSGLKYSNGTAVKASDFRYTIQEGSHLRDHPRRLCRDDRDPTRPAAGRLPLHPRDGVRARRSDRHTRKRPVDEADPGDGAVHGPGLHAEPELHARPESELQQPDSDDAVR